MKNLIKAIIIVSITITLMSCGNNSPLVKIYEEQTATAKHLSDRNSQELFGINFIDAANQAETVNGVRDLLSTAYTKLGKNTFMLTVQTVCTDLTIVNGLPKDNAMCQLLNNMNDILTK